MFGAYAMCIICFLLPCTWQITRQIRAHREGTKKREKKTTKTTTKQRISSGKPFQNKQLKYTKYFRFFSLSLFLFALRCFLEIYPSNNKSL